MFNEYIHNANIQNVLHNIATTNQLIFLFLPFLRLQIAVEQRLHYQLGHWDAIQPKFSLFPF